MDQKDLSDSRGVTLNSLLEEQRSLNMRMLLAVQLQDAETQEAINAELEALRLRIERMLSGTLRRQDLPQ